MAHLAKFTKAACGHMFKHYERAKGFNPDTGQVEYIKFANQEINSQRTHLNYNLAVHQTMRQGDFIRKRCSEVKLQNRKDVNVMCCWVLTAPKNLPEAERADFFKASYDFMANRYGEENVISAYVHLDETTPHIHFAFIPISEDKKKGGYKVSAKEVITKHELQAFHQELSKHLEKVLGHSVGVLNGATKYGNRSISELKEKSALERVEKAEIEACQSEKKAQAARCELLSVNAKVEAATEELKIILDKKSRASEIKVSHIFGETVSYHKNMLESTRSIGSEAYNELKKANELFQQVKALEIQNKQKEQELAPLYRQAQEDCQCAKELRENEERYIEETAQSIADKRIEEMFEKISDKRGIRLEKFCERLKFSDGTNALQAFEKQEQALKARNHKHSK